MKQHRWSSAMGSTLGLLTPAILVWGCSTTYSVGPGGKPDTEYSHEEMNGEIYERHVSIELRDGMCVVGGTGIGLVSGSPAGAMIGHSYIYEFR
jgi:hypothetical protein